MPLLARVATISPQQPLVTLPAKQPLPSFVVLQDRLIVLGKQSLSLLTQPLSDCTVTAQPIPNNTVAIVGGNILVASKLAVVASQNVTIPNAEQDFDRIDAIVADDTGTLWVIAGAPQPFSVSPPDVSGFMLLAYVTVLSYVSPGFTGTITPDVIDQSMLKYVGIPAPAQSLAYTYVAGNVARNDPGPGYFGFDSADPAAVAHVYINYNAANASGLAAGPLLGLAKTYKATFSPFHLRFYSRANLSIWYEVRVTGITNFGSWADLACTPISNSTYLVAAIPLSTGALDTLVTRVEQDATVGTLSLQINLLNGTTTYTPTAGVTKLQVEVLGAGGQGGGAANGVTACGGGGGSGSWASTWSTALVVGAHTVAIGAGGSGAAAGNVAGGNGGVTTFKDTAGTVIAQGNGGTGGGGGPAVTGPAISGVSGPGGAASTGDMAEAGTSGGFGVVLGTNQALSGHGASGPWGGGATEQNITGNGVNAGVGFGSGGSGGTALTASGARTGGTGSNGIIRVWEYT